MSAATITLLFLLFAVVMFVFEKIPLGVTSMIVCIGLVVTGVLDVKTAFAGFIDSNVILFVAMFIVGGALFETGMANKIGGIVTHFARSERSLIVAIMVIVGLMSGVLSNTGTAAVLTGEGRIDGQSLRGKVVIGIARRAKAAGVPVIAVVGDGALTGGMCYEALNDCGNTKTRLIVLLNDNEMSIAHNVGGVAHHLSKLRTRPGYFGIKRVYRSVTNKIPGGKFLYQLTHRMKTWMKNRLLDTTLFEDMGFTYIGPVDGG